MPRPASVDAHMVRRLFAAPRREVEAVALAAELRNGQRARDERRAGNDLFRGDAANEKGRATLSLSNSVPTRACR